MIHPVKTNSTLRFFHQLLWSAHSGAENETDCAAGAGSSAAGGDSRFSDAGSVTGCVVFSDNSCTGSSPVAGGGLLHDMMKSLQ